MRTDVKLSTLGMSTAAMLALVSGAAIAAEQPAVAQANTEAAGATTSGARLEEIVVTAQRRAENLQKAALAITAVTGDAIIRAGVTDTAQLTRIAPALQIGTLAGPQAQFYLRGVGNFTANSLSDAAVSVNIDGVPIVRSNAIQGLFYDLERIEVLKGPQGTLYGRNATGGAINLISAKPKLGEFRGYVNGEYGNFDAAKVSSAVNVPVGDDTAFRVAGIYSDRDGYYTDGSGDDSMHAFRAQVTSELTDTFTLTAGADFTHVGGNGSGSTLFGLDKAKYIGQTDPRAVAVWRQTFGIPAASFMEGVPSNFQDNDFWGAYAQADWQTAAGTLTVIPAYRHSDVFYRNSSSIVTINERMTDEQTTVEARFASDDSARLNYIIGAFYLDEAAREHPGYAEQVFNAHLRADSDTKSKAGFGRLTFRVTDKFRATAGVRYTIDEKEALLDAYNVVIVCPSFFAGGTPGSGPACVGTPILPITFDVPPNLVTPNGAPIPVQPWGNNGAIVTNTRIVNTAAKDFKKTTYRAALEYDLTSQSLLYVSYETGFKSGGFFSSIDDASFAPETIGAFTLGSKNRFFNDLMQLNIEVFSWTYEDQQVSHFRLNSVGDSEFVTENVGKTRINGIELEGKALVTDGTTLSATVQYLDAEYKDFVYSNPAANGAPVTGCPFTFTGAAFVVECSGRQTINAPEWTINAGIEQVFNFANSSRLIFNLDGRYQTESYTGFEQLESQLQDSYFLVDLQAQYELPGNQVTVAVFGNNLTDEEVVGFSAPHPFSHGTLVAQSLRPPRTYGVRVGYKF